MKQLLALLLLAPLLALAAAPTASLSWVPATLRADGTPLVGTPFFNIYQGASGAEVLAQSGVTSTPLTVTGTAGATVCFQVTQIEVSTGAESARSIEACKAFAVSPPAAPTGVTVK